MAYKTQIRVQLAIELITEGNSYSKTVSKLVQSENIAESTAKRYIKKAFEVIKDNFKEKTDNLLTLSINRLEYVYRKSLEKEDFANSLRALNQLNRLTGLYDKDSESNNDDLLKEIIENQKKLDSNMGLIQNE